MTNADGTSWVRAYYDDVDHMRMDPFLAWHTSDVTVQFGNNPPAHGADEVRGAIGHFWEMIGGLKHNIVNIWDTVDATTVVEANIDYTRLDGKVVVTPCVTLLHRAGTKDAVTAEPVQVDQVRIFIDLAPVFAP